MLLNGFAKETCCLGPILQVSLRGREGTKRVLIRGSMGDLIPPSQ